MKDKDNGLEQFIREQKLAQIQADRNEKILDNLVKEWEKYPDGKPIIKLLRYGKEPKK